MSATGGRSGGKNSGGGAGGRVAIYSSVFFYKGSIVVFGGSATQGHFGGPGTVFVQEIRDKRPFSQLWLDNLNRDYVNEIVLDEVNKTVYEFSALHLLRKASLRLALKNVKSTLKILKLFGDRTGLLKALAKHVVFLETSDTEHKVSKPSSNLLIEKNGEMVFGASIYVVGDGKPLQGVSSLVSDGRMTHVTNIYISKGTKVRFLRHAHTAAWYNGSLVVAEPGMFMLSLLEIQDGGQLLFPHSLGMHCTVGLIILKYGATVIADNHNVSVTSLVMEAGSRITASGDVRPTQDGGPVLPGSCRGSGGSHGSRGGKGTILLMI